MSSQYQVNRVEVLRRTYGQLAPSDINPARRTQLRALRPGVHPMLKHDDNGGAHFRAILLGWENAKGYSRSSSRSVAGVHGDTHRTR